MEAKRLIEGAAAKSLTFFSRLFAQKAPFLIIGSLNFE